MRQNQASQGRNSFPQIIKKNWIQAGLLALVSILLFFTAFSLPPWDMGSGVQDVAVVLMVVVLLLGWAGLGFVFAMASKNAPVSPSHVLPKTVRAASLASALLGCSWLIAFWVFDPGSEISVGLFLFFLVIGMCLSAAALTGCWVRWMGVPVWLGIVGGGLGGVIVLGGAVTVANLFLGDSVIQIDEMMLL